MLVAIDAACIAFAVIVLHDSVQLLLISLSFQCSSLNGGAFSRS